MSTKAGTPGHGANDVYQQTVNALVAATHERDQHAQGHSERVTAYCMAMAQHLDLDDDTLRNLRYAAGLHDVGKIGISRSILTKLGKLTDEEFEIMRMHSLIAVRILEKVEGLKDALPMIRHHHERFDGTGYPDGLVGDAIPLGARIISVAEAYDILTSDVPWRNAMGNDPAIEEIRRCSATQFDPKVVEALEKAVTSAA
jgi:HD-GYP domain-containing protein (c-di-GMP phosphodiesterase class II)